MIGAQISKAAFSAANVEAEAVALQSSGNAEFNTWRLKGLHNGAEQNLGRVSKFSGSLDFASHVDAELVSRYAIPGVSAEDKFYASSFPRLNKMLNEDGSPFQVEY